MRNMQCIPILTKSAKWSFSDQKCNSTYVNTVLIDPHKCRNWLSALDQYGRSPFRSGNNSKFSTIQTVFWKK